MASIFPSTATFHLGKESYCVCHLKIFLNCTFTLKFQMPRSMDGNMYKFISAFSHCITSNVLCFFSSLYCNMVLPCLNQLTILWYFFFLLKVWLGTRQHYSPPYTWTSKCYLSPVADAQIWNIFMDIFWTTSCLLSEATMNNRGDSILFYFLVKMITSQHRSRNS
jgi:hypothetical protein